MFNGDLLGDGWEPTARVQHAAGGPEESAGLVVEIVAAARDRGGVVQDVAVGIAVVAVLACSAQRGCSNLNSKPLTSRRCCGIGSAWAWQPGQEPEEWRRRRRRLRTSCCSEVVVFVEVVGCSVKWMSVLLSCSEIPSRREQLDFIPVPRVYALCSRALNI